MRRAMQRGFRNSTGAGHLLWQNAAVNREKNESAHCERCRPSRRLPHDRVPLIATSIAVSVCGSCVRCVSAIRLFVEYRRRLLASMAGMLRWLESTLPRGASRAPWLNVRGMRGRPGRPIRQGTRRRPAGRSVATSSGQGFRPTRIAGRTIAKRSGFFLG
jgi:hypothetical protein